MARSNTRLAFIGLGGNLGDVPATLTAARSRISTWSEAPLLTSGLYRSAPWGDTPGPPFVNQVIGLRTPWTPQVLLEALLALEAELGRVRTGRWAPRTLDLDLLAQGRMTVDSPTLTLPHPRLAERRFVLLPWAEIGSEFLVPGHRRTVRELLRDCPDSGAVSGPFSPEP